MLEVTKGYLESWGPIFKVDWSLCEYQGYSGRKVQWGQVDWTQLEGMISGKAHRMIHFQKKEETCFRNSQERERYMLWPGKFIMKIMSHQVDVWENKELG